MISLFRPEDARRLAFVKHVLALAEEHSRTFEPNCAVSLLELHDGIELLLQLAAEKLNIRVDRNTSFLGYWPLLSSALQHEVPNHGAMKRLNEARVALKHHGHLPSRSQVADFVEVAAEFVRALTPMIFGYSWEEVSRADFVRSDRVRTHLKAAEEAYARGELETCVIECRKAYETLITEYSPFHRQDYSFPLFVRGRLGSELEARTLTESPLSLFVDWVELEFSRLRHDLEALATGVDPARVAQFLRITPIVGHSANWNWNVVESTWRKKPISEDATFCLEFVLDAAAKIEARSG